jgi:hypothetical protein
MSVEIANTEADVTKWNTNFYYTIHRNPIAIKQKLSDAIYAAYNVYTIQKKIEENMANINKSSQNTDPNNTDPNNTDPNNTDPNNTDPSIATLAMLRINNNTKFLKKHQEQLSDAEKKLSTATLELYITVLNIINTPLADRIDFTEEEKKSNAVKTQQALIHYLTKDYMVVKTDDELKSAPPNSIQNMQLFITTIEVSRQLHALPLVVKELEKINPSTANTSLTGGRRRRRFSRKNARKCHSSRRHKNIKHKGRTRKLHTK